MPRREPLGEEHGWKNLLGAFFKHAAPKEIVNSQTIAIVMDSYCSFAMRMARFETFKLDVEVIEGGAIDILTMNDYNFGKYIQSESFVYIVSGSILNVRKVSNIFVAPENGYFHLVLDNTYYPQGGARPNPRMNEGKVKLNYTLRSQSPVQFDECYIVR